MKRRWVLDCKPKRRANKEKLLFSSLEHALEVIFKASGISDILAYFLIYLHTIYLAICSAWYLIHTHVLFFIVLFIT